MRNFTQDERNLMMLYSPGTLPGLCEALKQVKEQLGEDEEELCTLAVSYTHLTLPTTPYV